MEELDAFVRRFEELCSTRLGEVGGLAEDVFMGGEEALGWSDGDGDDGGIQWSGRVKLVNVDVLWFCDSVLTVMRECEDLVETKAMLDPMSVLQMLCWSFEDP